MGSKNNPGDFDCYENAEPDEPMFVLLARDRQSPTRVRNWASVYRIEHAPMNNRQRRKYDEALQCANDMEAWRNEHRS